MRPLGRERCARGVGEVIPTWVLQAIDRWLAQKKPSELTIRTDGVQIRQVEYLQVEREREDERQPS